MFGIVPKVLWQKTKPADDRNRVTMDMNCLLIRDADNVVVVETGAGPKLTDRQKEIFGIQDPPRLLDELKTLGVRPADVTLVINTHLHFDHSGGNTYRDDGRIVPTFPRASYVFQRREWEDAIAPNERSRGSYLPDVYAPLEAAGKLELIDESVEIFRGSAASPRPKASFGSTRWMADRSSSDRFDDRRRRWRRGRRLGVLSLRSRRARRPRPRARQARLGDDQGRTRRHPSSVRQRARYPHVAARHRVLAQLRGPHRLPTRFRGARLPLHRQHRGGCRAAPRADAPVRAHARRGAYGESRRDRGARSRDPYGRRLRR